MENIQTHLDALSEGVIKDYAIDILHNLITFNVTVIENGINSNYKVQFFNVSAYHFYNNIGDKRLILNEPDNDDYLELTSIQYLSGGVGNFAVQSKENWANQYYSNANFALEIWNSMLFIESSKIMINNVQFDLDRS